MTFGSCRTLAGSCLALFVMGAGASIHADDAKKQALKLAKCAAGYKQALQACESLEDAVACYQKADADDLACRKAAGAVGHSEVEPEIVRRRNDRLTITVLKKPLNCGTGINATCADGHARFPICEQSSQQSTQNAQGIGGDANVAKVVQDAQGEKDVCTGQTLRCPAGFTLVARKGQDLCWDSTANVSKYRY